MKKEDLFIILLLFSGVILICLLMFKFAAVHSQTHLIFDVWLWLASYSRVPNKRTCRYVVFFEEKSHLYALI